MSSRDHILSSEEALDEYFTALLSEEWETEEMEVATVEPAVQEVQDPKLTSAAENIKEQIPAVESAAAEGYSVDTTEPSVAETSPVKEPNHVVSGPANHEPERKITEETAPKAPELQSKVHPDYHASYTELEYNEFEAPDLKDIQKLLDKLESLNAAAEPDIVTILEQNTAEITKSETAVEEIQEWDIETLSAEPVAEVTEVTEVAFAEPEIVIEEAVEVEETVETKETVEAEQVEEKEAQVDLETQADSVLSEEWESTQRDEDFQVLYFEVNGVTFAVPLDELGGIHRTGEMSHLIGRPDWYLGLQTSKDDQLDVVDTARWVMAERLVDDSYKDAYQYVVMLGDSKWGLAGTQLLGTELLNADKVRWREQAGKRPWLAGMVKEKMCALIHVNAMISMLNAGLDVKALDN